MSFGFSIFPFDRYQSVGEMVEVAQCGDRLGFDALLLPEHLLPPEWPNAEMASKLWFDVPTLAAHFAAVTSRVKFLSGVTVVPYHHPVALAKALATLDVLSNGRVLFGAGAGWMRAEFRRLGLPYQERGAMTDDYLRAIIELWCSESPRYQGKYISFEDVSFYPKPVQKPHIPIMIGGTGPRPFQRIAELGNGWFPMTASIETMRSGLADIGARMERLGRDPGKLWVGYTGFGMGEDKQTRAMRHDAGDAAPDEGPARSAGEAIERIERFRRAGVTFLSMGFPWQTAGELMEQLERFASDVMPAFS